MAYATTTDLRAYLPQIPTYGQQTVTITGGPSGGTFTLVYEAVATAAIAFNAPASVLQTALQAVAAIGSSVKVTGPAGGPWVVDFSGNAGRSPLSLGTNSLTGGSSPGVSVVNTTEGLLTTILDRATDIVRNALRACLTDPTFDYAAYGPASTRIVQGYTGMYLTIPPHQLASVTLVEYQSATNPEAWGAVPDQVLEQTNGQLYRASGWGGGWGDRPRYRVTAVWGYGPTVPSAIEELTLELAANIWRSRDKGGFTEIVGVEGGGSVRAIAGLNKLQQQIVADVAASLWQVSV